jgi:methyl-accepting chemotaxis protein
MSGWNIGIAAASRGAGISAIVGFATVVGTAVYGLSTMKVGGPVYERIILAKDVVADVLPPPEFIIEGFLETTLALADPAKVEEHAKRLKVLKEDYENRQLYWADKELEPSVKESLTVESRAPASAFWAETESSFLPALRKGDQEGARRSYERLTHHFQVHREAIDHVVKGATEMAVNAEEETSKKDFWITSSIWTVSLLVALIMLASVWGVIRCIVHPLVRLTSVIKSVADDNLDLEVPFTESVNEIGEMSKSIETLRQGVLERHRLEEQDRERIEADRRRQESLKAGVQKFLDTSTAVLGTLKGQTAAMQTSAQTLMDAAGTSSTEAAAAVEAASDASANSQAVAAATEELSASIREIASQTSRTSIIISEASDEAAAADREVAGFVSVTHKIGSIVDTIRAIASQTNLLALNATIEAARAGDAGKGFAVVASEVKALAAQTENATAEVAQQIAAIQNSTSTTVGSVRAIASKIVEINGLSSAIAAAVEEQGSATQEIAERVGLAAEGTGVAAHKAESVSATATRTKAEASSIAEGAVSLAAVTQSIAEAVDEFLKVVGCDLDERRTSTRIQTSLPVDLVVASKTQKARVTDISKGGARLSGTAAFIHGAKVALEMSGRAISGRTVWSQGNEGGIQFDQPIEDVSPFLVATSQSAA